MDPRKSNQEPVNSQSTEFDLIVAPLRAEMGEWQVQNANAMLRANDAPTTIYHPTYLEGIVPYDSLKDDEDSLVFVDKIRLKMIKTIGVFTVAVTGLVAYGQIKGR